MLLYIAIYKLNLFTLYPNIFHKQVVITSESALKTLERVNLTKVNMLQLTQPISSNKEDRVLLAI